MTLSRRDWFTLSAAGWFHTLARAAAPLPARKRACILLWMSGGPSQMDTFDLKPGTDNGGPAREIATRAPGLRISEHLPKLAQHGDRLAVLRGMTTKEADHGRGTYLMRTGYAPTGPVLYPPLGAVVSHELGTESALPSSVSIAPARFFNPAAYGPGFLGPRHAPLVVGEGDGVRPATDLKVRDLDADPDVDRAHADARLDLLAQMEDEFHARHPGTPAASHRTAYARAVRLMKSDARKAFDLDDEKPALRDAYGRSLFGQGCLLARRLVERGVPFVEVSLNGWDTHQNNADRVRDLCRVLDPAWATLMTDLKERGLLDTTLIVWMGEFGRTPRINPGRGRDHWPNSWTTVLAGGGVHGGQAHGVTSKDGMSVERDPVTVADFMATVVKGLGINPEKALMSNVGRPIRIADKGGRVIEGVLR